jgi:hypothetical protein
VTGTGTYHLHIFLEDIWVFRGVLGHDFGDCRSPTQVSMITDSLELTYQLPEPTMVTLCFFENGVSADNFARTPSIVKALDLWATWK